MKRASLKIVSLCFLSMIIMGVSLISVDSMPYVFAAQESEDEREDEKEEEKDEDEDEEKEEDDDKDEDKEESKKVEITTEKIVVSETISKEIVTTTRRDTDGDGIFDEQDRYPDLNDHFIVNDENKNGIVDTYEK